MKKPYFRLAGSCPACHKAILDPFSRSSGPIPYFHRAGKNRPACRLIVTPDPNGGDSHSVHVVPHGTAVETFFEWTINQKMAA